MPRPPKAAEATPAPDEADAEAAMAAEETDAAETPDAEEEAPRPKLEPIGTVRRELVRPDGKKVYVDVPVYPPFRLADDASNAPKPPPRRLRPGAKPRKTG
jgi:hypothetical protein